MVTTYSESELIRVLNDLLEGDHKLSRLRAVHDAVVAGQVDLHLLLHSDAAVPVSRHCGLAAAHSQDGGGACARQPAKWNLQKIKAHC